MGVAAVILLTVPSCEPPSAPQSPPREQTPGPGTGGAAALPAASVATGYFTAVDLAGKPLPALRPIASREPNAFDEPVAVGQPTDTAGKAMLSFPSTEKLYLRLWDPELKYFANNFYEALPNQGNVAKDMKITMVESAALALRLETADGTPLVSQEIQLMMSHPVRGPWWPARAVTDGEGRVLFSRVPPGQFALSLTMATGERLELPETALMPGGTADLGVITTP